jgi:hypothetical protein
MPNVLKLCPGADVINKKHLVGFVIGFVFILNYPKLNLYFFSDDFHFLWQYQHLKDVFGASASYHVNPVPQFFIFYLGNRLAGFHPLYYHAITLLLHIINVVLVFNLAQVLFRNKWTSAVSSLLFATYFMNYEPVYWITGIFYILLAFFYISALLFFVRYLNEPDMKYYALFIAAFGLAVFTMEQGATLLAACMLCELMRSVPSEIVPLSNWKQKSFFGANSLKKYVMPIFIILSFFVIKKLMNQSFVVTANTPETVIKTIFGMIWHLFVPFPYGVSNGIFYNTSQWNYRVYLILLFSVGVIAYLLVKKFRRQIEGVDNSETATSLFLFGCILGYVVPLSLATMIQARYFYIPSVFSSIILGNLFTKSLASIIRPRNYKTLFLHLTITALIAASFPINVHFLRNQYRNWEIASEITRNIINDTWIYLSKKTERQNLYFVNLPDGIYSQSHFGWPNAYIFRNGIFEAIRLNYPARNIAMIKEYRTENPEGVTTWFLHELVTVDKLYELGTNDNNLVLVYDPNMRTIKRFTKSPL